METFYVLITLIFYSGDGVPLKEREGWYQNYEPDEVHVSEKIYPTKKACMDRLKEHQDKVNKKFPFDVKKTKRRMAEFNYDKSGDDYDEVGEGKQYDIGDYQFLDVSHPTGTRYFYCRKAPHKKLDTED